MRVESRDFLGTMHQMRVRRAFVVLLLGSIALAASATPMESTLDESSLAARAGPRVFRQGTFADESIDWGGNYVNGRQWAGGTL